MKYHFEQSSLVFGYHNQELLGMYFLFDGETFTRNELFDIFEGLADRLITVPVIGENVPRLHGDAGPEQLQQALIIVATEYEELLDRAAENQIHDRECQYQISKVLH